MHVFPSSAQAAYDKASSSCKLAAPRIVTSLDEMPLNVLCDPDRGTLEAVELRGLHAAEVEFVELEVSGGRFSKCQFLDCDFTGALFTDIAFDSCDFSNSIFDSAAFTRCTFSDCKFAGASFAEALWKHVAADGCTFVYGAFNRCLWKTVRARTCDFLSADMSEMELCGISLDDDRFVGTSFFRTKLVGLDFTSCQLEGIVISDAMDEVHGAKLGLYQAAALARRLGVIIEE